MKQYSRSGRLPGVAGAVDLDAFYGTTAQLRAYGRTG
jgi:GH25 family lysozyme M1 (1,4-beta-N-acetylmuramidase)